MPSSITHQLVAEETKKRLPEQLKKIVDAAPDEYYFGSQGPDFLFFYRIGSKKEYNLGKFLHRYRVFDVFGLFLRAAAQDPTDGRVPHFTEEERIQVLAYCLGYITHYATDGTFHPFVYRYMEKTKAPRFVHQQIENDWDVYFLRRLKNTEADKVQWDFSLEKIASHKTAARLYRFLASSLDREPVKLNRFNGGLKNFARYLRFFHKKCYGKQHRWVRREKFFRTNPLLSALYPRRTPSEDILRSEDYGELSLGRGNDADALFNRSVEESVRLSLLFYSALGNGEALLREDFGRGLLTGEVL